MGQVLEFKPRNNKVEDKRPSAGGPIRSPLRTGRDAPEAVIPLHAERIPAIDLKAMGVEEMIKQSAVMQVISTLAFYAKQGYDGGEKARRAMGAMREIMTAEAMEAAPAV